MSVAKHTLPILVCDENPHARKLVAEVLIGAGYLTVHFASNGLEMLKSTEEHNPRIVLTSSRIPGISGLEYTRLIRAGHNKVSRVTSVIVMTDTPTTSFLTAARDAGVDEMLVRPFNGAGLLARVEAVLARPRRFVESTSYVGPCRRRRMLEEYGGPQRRASNANESPNASEGGPAWEAPPNRALMRACVERITQLTQPLKDGNRDGLRALLGAVRECELLADEVSDKPAHEAARSMTRYLNAMSVPGMFDPQVAVMHVDALGQLCVLGGAQQGVRDKMASDLVAMVDKRLGHKTVAA
jgi:DNA-binding response OmpR family regulator